LQNIEDKYKNAVPKVKERQSQRVERGPVGSYCQKLVFEVCRSCGDLVGFGGFNSVFERDACDDFSEVVKAAQLPPVLLGALSELEHHVRHTIA
jgi:hypothetical protein